jgi:hypothetical protein
MQRAELRTAMVKEWYPVDLESSRAVGRPEIFRKLLQGQLKQAVATVCRLPLDRIATLTPRLSAAPDPVVATAITSLYYVSLLSLCWSRACLDKFKTAIPRCWYVATELQFGICKTQGGRSFGAPVGPVELALGEFCEDVCHVLILRGVSAHRARTQTPLINPDRHAVVARKVADHPCINKTTLQ